jgi:predicted nucleotidyltransferase
MEWTAQSILKTLSQHRHELQQVGVRKIGLFGSYSRGDQSEQSDMDFLVTFDRNTFDSYMDTLLFLEKLFNRPVDLAIEADLKPRLRSYILDEVQYAEGF